jgi:hypothetical protein
MRENISEQAQRLRRYRVLHLLKPYPVASDALLEIGTTVIPTVLSLDEHLSQINISCVPKFCYQLVYCCLIRHFLFRIRITKCFTNSSKRFRCEECSRMNTRSARERTMFALAQPLPNWPEQQFRNQVDLDSNVTEGVERVCYTGWTCF